MCGKYSLTQRGETEVCTKSIQIFCLSKGNNTTFEKFTTVKENGNTQVKSKYLIFQHLSKCTELNIHGAISTL